MNIRIKFCGVVHPADAIELLDSLGAPTRHIREERNERLWDTWPLLAVCLALVSFEWILRKKVGLT